MLLYDNTKQEAYMKPHIHTITELAIFTAIAFIFSYIESLFPLPIPFPGIKLGLANLVIVLVLYKNGFCQALTVSIVRGLLIIRELNCDCKLFTCLVTYNLLLKAGDKVA